MGDYVRIEGLDQIDNRILEILQTNARISLSDLGKELGISRVSVRTRIERMEKNGIIRGYRTIVDPTALPQGIRFTIDIEAAPGMYQDVIAAFASQSMIHEIYGTSGESHIHAAGVAANSETLGSNARYLFRTVRGIRKLNWQILVTTYKNLERGITYRQEDDIRTDQISSDGNSGGSSHGEA